jgi:hypothetical protein
MGTSLLWLAASLPARALISPGHLHWLDHPRKGDDIPRWPGRLE